MPGRRFARRTQGASQSPSSVPRNHAGRSACQIARITPSLRSTVRTPHPSRRAISSFSYPSIFQTAIWRSPSSSSRSSRAGILRRAARQTLDSAPGRRPVPRGLPRHRPRPARLPRASCRRRAFPGSRDAANRRPSARRWSPGVREVVAVGQLRKSPGGGAATEAMNRTQGDVLLVGGGKRSVSESRTGPANQSVKIPVPSACAASTSPALSGPIHRVTDPAASQPSIAVSRVPRILETSPRGLSW